MIFALLMLLGLSISVGTVLWVLLSREGMMHQVADWDDLKLPGDYIFLNKKDPPGWTIALVCKCGKIYSASNHFSMSKDPLHIEPSFLCSEGCHFHIRGGRMIDAKGIRIFYFGCWGESGHYLWTPDHSEGGLSRIEELPWKYQIDSGLCPSGPEVQGNALLHHKDGWTALAFWDRTVDQRGKSNSAFIADGILSFEQIVQISKEAFPEIWQRIGTVNLVKEE